MIHIFIPYCKFVAEQLKTARLTDYRLQQQYSPTNFFTIYKCSIAAFIYKKHMGACFRNFLVVQQNNMHVISSINNILKFISLSIPSLLDAYDHEYMPTLESIK